MLAVSAEDIEAAIKHLLAQSARGIVLVDDGTAIELRSAPVASDTVAEVRKQEFSREIGRAGAEVIAILLYKGPSTRSSVDFIRGVNSTQALRTLSMRGLVRKVALTGSDLPAQAGRSVAYELTTELMASLGISRPENAPEYADIRKKLDELKQAE
jgi:chromosome segregation and condensation protein ScpB